MMNLTIHSPKGVLFSGEVRYLQIPASSGIMQIMARHEPSVAVLKEGFLRFEDKEGKIYEQQVSSGVVETLQSRTTVLLAEF